MVVCNGSHNNNNRIDDPRNVILFCDLMAADEEEEEDENDNKKEKGGFKVKDIEHGGGAHKWRMHLPFQKMDGTEIVMSVYADDKWLVERIRSIVNGKKVCLYLFVAHIPPLSALPSLSLPGPGHPSLRIEIR